MHASPVMTVRVDLKTRIEFIAYLKKPYFVMAAAHREQTS